MAPTEFTLPQLALLLLLSGLAIRFLFFTPSSSPSPNSSNPSSSSAGRIPGAPRVREEQVAQVQTMFPQVARRNIIWELQRNGGDVGGCVERILGGRLENPPITFQPPPAPPSPAATTSSSSTIPKSKDPSQPDLITRYNLSSKLAETSKQDHPTQEEEGGKKHAQAWSQNKNERQALLQKRREEMILQARRKMEERVRAEQGGKSRS